MNGKDDHGMAHIPYGYRIRNGKAEADPEDAGKLMTFIGYYLAGMSIRTANKKAGTGRCDDSLRRLLRNRVYLGDSYYPQLISEERFEKIAEELEKRTHPPTRSIAQGTGIKTRFRIRDPEPDGGGGWQPAELMKKGCDPVRITEYFYSLIEPHENGSRRMTDTELAGLRRWRQKVFSGLV